MEANHMLRNAFFSDLDLPKSNMFDFSLAQTMMGPLVATKEWAGFLFSRAPILYCHSPWKIWKSCSGGSFCCQNRSKETKRYSKKRCSTNIFLET